MPPKRAPKRRKVMPAIQPFNWEVVSEWIPSEPHCITLKITTPAHQYAWIFIHKIPMAIALGAQDTEEGSAAEWKGHGVGFFSHPDTHKPLQSRHPRAWECSIQKGILTIGYEEKDPTHCWSLRLPLPAYVPQ